MKILDFCPAIWFPPTNILNDEGEMLVHMGVWATRWIHEFVLPIIQLLLWHV